MPVVAEHPASETEAQMAGTISERWRAVCIFLSLVLSVGVFACAGSQKRIEDRKKAEAFRGVGEAYLVEGRVSLALRELLKAERLYADDNLLQYDLGMAYKAKGRYDDAIAHFQKALALKPDFAPAKNSLGTVYLEKGDIDRAIPIFEALTEDILYGTPHYPLYNLGRAYYQKKDFVKAEGYFREALELRPEYVQARYWLARTYLERGLVSEAVGELKKALNRAPQSGPLHYELGRAYLMAGKADLALKHYETAVAVSPPESDLAEQAKMAAEDLRKR
jgi:Tfp pilus assembly protein PilF